MKKRYTNKRKTKRNRLFRKTVRGGNTPPVRNKYIEHYDADSIFLFNEDVDIFGDSFGTPTQGMPIYGKYTIEQWSGKNKDDKFNMPRAKREEELKAANIPPTGKAARVKGRIEPVVEYINKKNKQIFDAATPQNAANQNAKHQNANLKYPFVLGIPDFNYQMADGTTGILNEETVPDSTSTDFEPILPDDFLRFTRRSDVLYVLFPYFMKVYISLQKELNENVGQTNVDDNKKMLEAMDFVLYILREIHGFASPIWFSPIYSAFYKMGLSKYFKIAKMGYDKYLQKLNQALAKTEETPVETTMYSFPSYVNCYDANCEPDIQRPIHSIFMRSSEFDEQVPVDSYLNMLFYGKDTKTTTLSALKNVIQKGPVASRK